MSNFAELAKINVNDHTEKKNGLTYLSWAWAVDQLLRQDPTATWEYRFSGEQPFVKIGETCMVFCTVKAFGVERTAQLPVMDHRNKAIQNPDAFQVNVAMQRCLAKAIALHGIGLYIYAGEDLPEGAEKEEPKADPETLKALTKAAEKGRDAFYKAWSDTPQEKRKLVPQSVLADLKAKCDEADADLATQA